MNVLKNNKSNKLMLLTIMIISTALMMGCVVPPAGDDDCTIGVELLVQPAIQGEGSVSIFPEEEIYCEGDEVTLTATPIDGFEFVNWTYDDGNVVSEDDEFTYVVPEEDVVLTANFVEIEEIETYSLSFNVNPEDAGTVESAGSYEAGDEITLTATANEDYSFVNWTYDDGSLANDSFEFSFIMPGYDVNLIANFEELPLETYSVKFVVVKDEEGNSIDGANVSIYDLDELINYDVTGHEGSVVFELSRGSYSCDVVKEGYDTHKCQLALYGDNYVEEVVVLNSIPPETYEVRFFVKNKDGEPLKNAEVTFNGTLKFTDELGVVVFEDVLKEKYGYEVVMDTYKSVIDTIEVTSNIRRLVTLEYSFSQN